MPSGRLVHFEKKTNSTSSSADASFSAEPLTVGVVFSGGTAPGGHNVVAGLHDALKKLNARSELFGFRGGPSGITHNSYIRVTRGTLRKYRNAGGFDLLGTGRTKISTPQQFEQVTRTCQAHSLDALIVIGGDDSNTNAAFIAESLRRAGVKTTVHGVPKTIDADLHNRHIDVSFGYDSACKTYAHEVSAIARDARSNRKYWWIIKLMGRSASHICVETALQTRPNICLVSEEVRAKPQTLADITRDMADVVCARSKLGTDYGDCLVPEGLIEFVPEVGVLIAELNVLLAVELHAAVLRALKRPALMAEYMSELLSAASRRCFESLPVEIQLQLLMDRDAHGNVNVSQIATEELLGQLLAAELKRRRKRGEYAGKFAARHHFCGYQGRSVWPSAFDANYCYGLGHVAALLCAQRKRTGLMACLSGLAGPVASWKPRGVPITSMLNFEQRHGKRKAVIRKALVRLDRGKFLLWRAHRAEFAIRDAYLFTGGIAYDGATALVDRSNYHVRCLKLRESSFKNKSSSGMPQQQLRAKL
jgi:pyrophosphate--fructose-6-phosphate 1-phosphotransferase